MFFTRPDDAPGKIAASRFHHDVCSGTRSEELVDIRLAIAAVIVAAYTGGGPAFSAPMPGAQTPGAPVPGAPPDLPALDSARLIADISALAADSMEGRRIGTPGGARARGFLLRAIATIGLSPVRDSFPMQFSVKERAGNVLNGVNLAGVIRGTRHPNRYIVLSAHYDHLGVRNGAIYNGADDNASGTAAVIAMAQWFKRHPPENSIIFAWFDGEEEGLLGAKAFLEDPPVPIGRIVANVNLDMVSRNVNGELYASGASAYPVMKPLLDSVATIAPVKLLLGHDTGTGESNWIQQSDQGAFYSKKIPFVYFGVEDHPDYHKPGDKVEHIQPGFYYHCAQTIAEFVRRLDLGLARVATL